MKKLLFLLAVVGFCACTPTAQNDVDEPDNFDYTVYKVCGKQYILGLQSDVEKGDYNLFKFQPNGKCDVDYYSNNKYSGDGIYDYYYWMVGDSIFIDCSPKREYKFLKGFYYNDYIILNNSKMPLVNKEK